IEDYEKMHHDFFEFQTLFASILGEILQQEQLENSECIESPAD
ncbi:9095_t:CDS:1, partial [Entrophospora sp. SA101]